VYERFEDFCIVPPEGVVGIVSVKKTLYGAHILNELTSLRDAARLCLQPGRRGPFTGLFAFHVEKSLKSRSPQTALFSAIAEIYAGQPFDVMITEASVFREFIVFKFRQTDSDRNGFAKYVNVECKAQGHIALQRLLNSILSTYYDPSRGSPHQRPGFVSFEKDTFHGAPVLGYVPIISK
jgi:hypothetical protein